MKTLTQYLDEFYNKFAYPNLNRLSLEQHKNVEAFLRTALTEVAKGMVGKETNEANEDKYASGQDYSHDDGYNKAIAEQEEKFNKFIK
jgi:hypothetical protein